MSDHNNGSPGTPGSPGYLRGVLTDALAWLERFIVVADPRDLELLVLWIAHTHVADAFFTTPRLILDSPMPGSGKTTVLDHIKRLGHSPVQMASISSAALLARLLKDGPRTLLVDEVDRTLDPKNPSTTEIVAIINSGYRRGGARPVLVSGKNGDWMAEEMPTFGPVVMAGNSPHLPDDTRSRSLRIVLLPDLDGRAEDSDWEFIEPDAITLGETLRDALKADEQAITLARPDLPEGCTGRARERWAPLARIAYVAGGTWFDLVLDLIARDLAEVEMDRQDGMTTVRPAVTLVRDLHEVWPEAQTFMRSADLINLLVNHNPLEWGEISSYGKRLTPQRMGRMLAGMRVYSEQRFDQVRGYQRGALEKVWSRLVLRTPKETGRTVTSGKTGGRGAA